MKLKDINCLTTGASSGIGLSIVKELLNEGAHVFAISIDPMELSHKNLINYTCDLSKETQVIASFNKAIETMSTIDVYIANAGQARYGFSEGLGNTDRDLLFDLNVKAVMNGLNLMKKKYRDKPFTFVATSSVMAFWPLPGYSTYSATKAAISTYVKGYRHEVNKNQKLILVYPVATNTNFFKVSGQNHKSWMIQSPELVAKKVIKGIKRGTKDIYPSFLFKFTHNFFPFLLKPYIKREIKILNKN